MATFFNPEPPPKPWTATQRAISDGLRTIKQQYECDKAERNRLQAVVDCMSPRIARQEAEIAELEQALKDGGK